MAGSTPPARARSKARTWRAIACAVVIAGCTGTAIDPGYSAVVTNLTERDVVIREGNTRWHLPGNASGLVFVTIGGANDASPVDYEVLEPATCEVLARVHVEFVRDHVTEVVVGAAGAVQTRVLNAEAPGLQHISATERCPVPGS